MCIVCRVFVAPIVFPSTLSFRECDIGSFVYGGVEVMNTFFADSFFVVIPFLLKPKTLSRVRFLHRRVVRFFIYLRVCVLHRRVVRFFIISACAFLHRRVVRLFIINSSSDTSRVRLYTGALYVLIIIPLFSF